MDSNLLQPKSLKFYYTLTRVDRLRWNVKMGKGNEWRKRYKEIGEEEEEGEAKKEQAYFFRRGL